MHQADPPVAHGEEGLHGDLQGAELHRSQGPLRRRIPLHLHASRRHIPGTRKGAVGRADVQRFRRLGRMIAGSNRQIHDFPDLIAGKRERSRPLVENVSACTIFCAIPRAWPSRTWVAALKLRSRDSFVHMNDSSNFRTNHIFVLSVNV